MAGVDHVIKLGIGEPTRLGIMGWSYGGYLSAWAVTQTDRFKAASVGAGFTDLISFTGTTDIPAMLPDRLGGEFWEKPDLYRTRSPLFHVKAVKTPTLIQHGERDTRAPVSQALEFYNALKRTGCSSRMVVYTKAGHSIDDPSVLQDCMERNLDWFDRYVRNAK
jgi:dipeptidyl aminopeptidase/acylaminoacyl peptidase